MKIGRIGAHENGNNDIIRGKPPTAFDRRRSQDRGGRRDQAEASLARHVPKWPEKAFDTRNLAWFASSLANRDGAQRRKESLRCACSKFRSLAREGVGFRGGLPDR